MTPTGRLQWRLMNTVIEPKPGVDVGRVVVTVIVENHDDGLRSDRGEIPPEKIRRVTVGALVDSGATFLCLPQSMIDQLGLPFNRKRETRGLTGNIIMRIFSGARVDVQGRACTAEVMALADDRQALLGQIPLESLDWWIDVANHRLVGNPEHGGQWMAEV